MSASQSCSKCEVGPDRNISVVLAASNAMAHTISELKIAEAVISWRFRWLVDPEGEEARKPFESAGLVSGEPFILED
jgi:hypothetical protein